MPVQAVPPRPIRTGRSAGPLWREVAGAVLRERRRGAELRLRDVAERAGISAQYLSEVERGRKEPSSEMLESICGALEMNLLDLVQSVGSRLLASGSGLPGTALTALDLAGAGPTGGTLGSVGQSRAVVLMAA